MMNNNKKGFTLVELLAVLVILVVLVFITVPIASSVISNAKMNSSKNNMLQYVKQIAVAQTDYQGDHNGTPNYFIGSLDILVKNLNIKEEQVAFDEDGIVQKAQAKIDEFYCKYELNVGAECSKEPFTTTKKGGTLMANFLETPEVLGILGYYNNGPVIPQGLQANNKLSSINSITFSNMKGYYGKNGIDVSENKDKSVMLYYNDSDVCAIDASMEDTSSNASNFNSQTKFMNVDIYGDDSCYVYSIDLLIVSDGNVSFPSDSSYLFSFKTVGEYFDNEFNRLMQAIDDGNFPGGLLLSEFEFNKNSNNLLLNNSLNEISSPFFMPVSLQSYDMEEIEIKRAITSYITKINFNYSIDTTNTVNMKGMFFGNSKISELDLSSFNTNKVTDMSYMFLNIPYNPRRTMRNESRINYFLDMFKLSKINLGSNFDTSNVTNMKLMFGLCVGVDSIDVSGFNTSKVTDMALMFAGCIKLLNIDISNFNTANVTNMMGMFGFCINVQKLELKKFDTKNVTNMAGMFLMCNGLKEINLSNFNTANVTNMMGMFIAFPIQEIINNSEPDLSQFDDESKIINIVLGDNFITTKVTNMALMFGFNMYRKNLDLSKINTSNVTNMMGMFEGCVSLTSLNLSNFNTSKVTNMAGMFSECISLTSLNLSNFNTSSVDNMAGMFSGCNSLTSLDLTPLDTSNVTDMSSMFSGCNSLTSLNISNFNTSNVTDMYDMFSRCSSLVTLNISSFDTLDVTDMSSMFNGCSSLNGLNISNFNTSNVLDMSQMFYNCSNLTSLNISNFNTANVTNTTSMFYNCSLLTNIYVSSNWIITSVTSSDNMFYNCTKLPNFNSTVVNITNANTTSTGYLTLQV